MSKLSAISMSGLAVLLVSAGPTSPPDELIRLGNEAYSRGDVDSAESLYQEAEERASDPGLVAFNKGAALYRRGDFRRAELCFRRALGDAAIPADRRTRSLYNLGNCLVREAGDNEVKLLQAAIDCYDLAVRESSDEGLRADAEHNLEVAKLLWAKARARRPQNERDPDWDEPKEQSRPPMDPNKKEDMGSDSSNDGPKTPDPIKKLEPGKGNDPGLAPKESPKPVPGQGNLPVLPDTDQVDQYKSPEHARSSLEWHAERIRRERQKLREEAAQGERVRANDW